MEFTHKLIIDEYYANGYNKYKAVQAVKPGTNKSLASTLFTVLFKKAENKAYIQEKLSILRANSDIKAIQVLRELINFSFSDITDYLELSLVELSELPADLRRCISSFERKKTTYLPRGAKKGEEVTEEVVKIKLIDKIKALEMVNKHIGFYEEDNRQKGMKIDLSKATNVQLNVLLQLTEQQS